MEYSSIREMASTKRVPYALIALAQFRRPEDIELIGSYLNERRWMLYGLKAIGRFPDDLFLVRLEQIHGDQLSQPLPSLQILVSLYEALVQYKSEASLTTMKDDLSAADDFAASMNRVALAVALARYPSTYFESVQEMLILSQVEKNAVQQMLANPD
jgi:hypothetical protein